MKITYMIENIGTGDYAQSQIIVIRSGRTAATYQFELIVDGRHYGKSEYLSEILYDHLDCTTAAIVWDHINGRLF